MLFIMRRSIYLVIVLVLVNDQTNPTVKTRDKKQPWDKEGLPTNEQVWLNELFVMSYQS